MQVDRNRPFRHMLVWYVLAGTGLIFYTIWFGLFLFYLISGAN